MGIPGDPTIGDRHELLFATSRPKRVTESPTVSLSLIRRRLGTRGIAVIACSIGFAVGSAAWLTISAIFRVALPTFDALLPIVTATSGAIGSIISPFLVRFLPATPLLFLVVGYVAALFFIGKWIPRLLQLGVNLRGQEIEGDSDGGFIADVHLPLSAWFGCTATYVFCTPRDGFQWVMGMINGELVAFLPILAGALCRRSINMALAEGAVFVAGFFDGLHELLGGCHDEHSDSWLIEDAERKEREKLRRRAR